MEPLSVRKEGVGITLNPDVRKCFRNTKGLDRTESDNKKTLKENLYGRDKAEMIYRLIIICLSITTIFGQCRIGYSAAKDIRLPGLDKKLIEAIQKGDTQQVRDLISKGAKVNFRTEFGDTPLHLAEKKEIAEILIRAGADINARNNEFGMTPLFNTGVDISKLLIDRGADVNAKAKKGMTPLAWAVYWDDIGKIKLLLSRGAAVNVKDDDGKSPLHIAGNWGKLEIASLLISKGADVNAKDDSCWTPLHWAVFEGNVETIQFLIDKGADRNARSCKAIWMFPSGSTPLDISEKSRSFEFTNYLKSKGCKKGKE